MIKSSSVFKALVIEDKDDDAKVIEDVVESAGGSVLRASSIADAEKVLGDRGAELDLVTLDRDLGNGVEEGVPFIDNIRRHNARLPVMIVSRFPQDDDVPGALFYLRKPVNRVDLQLRINRITHRAFVDFERLQIDLGRNVARLDGRALVLKPQHFALLEALVVKRDQDGRVSNDDIFSSVWPDVRVATPEEKRNKVHSCVSKLRKILGEYGVEDAIETINNFGYRLRSAPLQQLA